MSLIKVKQSSVDGGVGKRGQRAIEERTNA